ncbi:phage holin family protein [uncultured Parvimonas sp.]|uniref:phage holin family protein n=1 Tax=uncultured Parvimonas sp. TaxID=747372 RepID=UPI0028D1D4D1|nr:phage holin family protein [uncultured Parvimonas sp.]
MMIEFLRELMITQDTKILFVLGLIAVAMIIDFLTGTVSAKINKDIIFESQKGINGILRKICSMLVMIFFIPVSILIPEGIGVGLIYVLYLGYLIMEIKSILENLKKMGLDVTLFKTFVDEVEKNKK